MQLKNVQPIDGSTWVHTGGPSYDRDKQLAAACSHHLGYDPKTGAHAEIESFDDASLEAIAAECAAAITELRADHDAYETQRVAKAVAEQTAKREALESAMALLGPLTEGLGEVPTCVRRALEQLGYCVAPLSQPIRKQGVSVASLEMLQHAATAELAKRRAAKQAKLAELRSLMAELGVAV